MGDMMQYFNEQGDEGEGSHAGEEESEFKNVTGLVLGRNDSFVNIEMGFKDPEDPESPTRAPSYQPSAAASMSQDNEGVKNPLDEVKASLASYSEDEQQAGNTITAPAAPSNPVVPSPAGKPKPLDSYDFSYSADSHDSPISKAKTEDGPYKRQVSSPIMDHLIETLSDVDETSISVANPKASAEEDSHEKEINQFMGSIPSNFDKEPDADAEKPKLSPRVSEKLNMEKERLQERRKSAASVDANTEAVQEQKHHNGHHMDQKEVDRQDMAVVLAEKEKKKKKKPTDNYMNEFQVVHAGKKPTQPNPKSDYDELDMKNRPKKKKSNDSYLSEIPVVKVSKGQKSPRPGIHSSVVYFTCSFSTFFFAKQ